MSNLISTIWSSQKYLLVPGLDRTSFQPRLTRFVLDKLSLLLWLKGVNGGLRYVEIVRRAVKIWGWIKIEVKFSERGPLIDLRLTCGSGLESKMISVYTKYYVQMAFNIQWGGRENFAEFLNRGFAISLVLTWIQVSTQYRALVSIARRNLILRASLLTVHNRRNSFGFLKKGFQLST